jgi:hypothetical protein
VSIFLIWSVTACSFVPALHSPTPWPTPSFSEVIAGFSSPDANERVYAADWAGFYHDHPDKMLLIPYLVEALSDPACGERDFSVRGYAAQSLRGLGIYNERAIEILVSWLDEEGLTGDELIQGIYTLEAFAGYASDATPGLIRVMMNPPSQPHRIRQATARALSAISDPGAVPYLLLVFLSNDEETWVRKSTAIALAYYGPEAVCTVPYLVSLLDSPELDVRVGAAIVISQATGNQFPDSERDNWMYEYQGGGYSVGSWQFEKNTDGELLIVVAAEEWWHELGQYQEWPQCASGLDGEPVLPAPGSWSFTAGYDRICRS